MKSLASLGRPAEHARAGVAPYDAAIRSVVAATRAHLAVLQAAPIAFAVSDGVGPQTETTVDLGAHDLGATDGAPAKPRDGGAYDAGRRKGTG